MSSLDFQVIDDARWRGDGFTILHQARHMDVNGLVYHENGPLPLFFPGPAAPCTGFSPTDFNSRSIALEPSNSGVCHFR